MRRVLILVLTLLAAAVTGVLVLGKTDSGPTPAAVGGPTRIEISDSSERAPKGLQGVWAARESDCAPGRETRLVITANRMTFHEASGPILAVVAASDGDVVFKVELTGEGWTRVVEHRFRFDEEADTLTALDATAGTTLSRRRCPP